MFMADEYVVQLGEMIKEAEGLEIVAQPEITLSDISEKGVEYLFTLTFSSKISKISRSIRLYFISSR